MLLNPRRKPLQEQNISFMGYPQTAHYLTYRFHLAVRVYSDNAQMTSNVVRTKTDATRSRRVAWLMFSPCFDVLCALSKYTHTAKWNLFVLYTVLISLIPHKNRNVFKNLRNDDLREHNFAGSLLHSCICNQKLSNTVDQWKRAFYSAIV